MRHIAFIMDGNRRWAKKFQNLANFGHDKGSDNIESILKLALEKNIEYVSMWALSTENIISRSTTELTGIYSLIEKKIPTLVPKLIKNGVRFEIVGDLTMLPNHIVDILTKAREDTKLGSTMTFIIALAYGGQNEIIRGIQKFIQEGGDSAALNEKTFLSYIDTGAYPAPDLIVRTGGDIRHSGFYLYQSAYSEYFYTSTLWPDFSEKDFNEAYNYFETSVHRNFGK